MKKYFLHNGTESSGPFDLEELKAKRITKSSPVWFEGMENWKTAGEIPELSTFFAVIPPPLSGFSAVAPKPKTEKKEQREILGLSRKTFFIVLGSLVLLAIITVLNTIEDNRSRELELRNHKTDIENHKYELQQKEIVEQKNIEIEQQKAEAERAKKERKQTISNRLLEIQILLDSNTTNLTEAKIKLADSSSFKFLRTAAEKKAQMDLLKKSISDITIDNENLKKESQELKLELEKIK